MLSISSNDTYDPLFSTQKEVYAKVIAHATEFLVQDSSNKVIMRLPSGETDIIVLYVALLRKYRVTIDNGLGKARTSIWFGNCHQASVQQYLGCMPSVETITFPPFSKKAKINVVNSWKSTKSFKHVLPILVSRQCQRGH